jgi:glycosyltransferase involved in cell wall biosynthesis
MFQRKGVQYVLRAVAKLGAGVEIHVVGDGPYLGKLKRLASELELPVTFWGWVDGESEDLKWLYETSSIFVFTSDQENFPVNLLEAMCAGNAIITTTSASSSEVVGDCAIKVAPRDPDAIADAITQLLRQRDYAQELGRRARVRLVSEFSWERVATRYEATMQSLVDHHRSIKKR